MGKLTELEQWDEDIYQIETSDPVLGGPEGVSNRPQKQLANRTQWLKKRLEDANSALAEHEKSRNHPDATLTAKGFVRLYSGVTSLDETMAATPKAVKIAMDNANERLAKARNLADLQSVPLALTNLTLANVKKAVEDTQIGLSKLPTFRPETEDDLDALPVGFIGECKNKTPGGPLPTEVWCYIQKTGNLDNYSSNPKRKGGTIRLVCIYNAGETWTGAKFDNGTTEGERYEWSRDFNTLNKPKPEDVGLAATKKAIDDTQTGLAAQSVMWIASADDLSNLPSGARRFASNKAPATVLPTAGYFFLEVLAKRDTANGSCILATSDTRDVWIGFRYTVPDEAGFTWIQLNQNVQNLGLKETLNPTKRVSIGSIGTGAFDGSTPSINIGDSDSGFIGSADGVLDIYCNNAKVGYIDNAGLHMLAGIATNNDLVLQSDERRHIIIQNADGSARAYIYKDKDDTGIHINNGVDGWGDFVLGKDSVLYVPFAVRAGGSKKLAIQSDNNSTQSATFNLWGDANRPTVIELDDDQGWHLFSQRNTDGSILFEVNGRIMAHTALHSGDATLATDGNVYGTIWGGWLNDWLNNNKAAKNTASLATNGWFKDASTGLIIQWGIAAGNLNKAVVNLPIPFPNAGLWSLGWVSGTLDMGNDDWSNSASLLNNSQLTVTTDHWWSTAWIAIGH
ncbi:tail fiber protein [Salmonella enterica]|uniref:tail fiber protein n=1 Tax=Salmonella enterica TaxID=28901 RepID=UPI0039183C83